MSRRALAAAVGVIVAALAMVAYLLQSTPPASGGADPVIATVPGDATPDSTPATAGLPAPAAEAAAPTPLSAEIPADVPASPSRPTAIRAGAEPVVLRGRVVDSAGAPVSGAELRFGWHANDERLRERAWADAVSASHRLADAEGVWSDADGGFALFLDAAHMRTQTRAHGFVVALAEGLAVLVHRTPELRVDAIDLGELRLARGTWLVARTVDPAGNPLPGVTASFEVLVPARADDVRSGLRLAPQVDDAEFSGVLRAVLGAESDARGLLRLDWLPEGAGRLRFARDDLAAALLPHVRLVLPGPVDLGEVVLDPGGTIAGRLIDVEGRPVAGGFAAVTLRDDGTGRDAEHVRQDRARAAERLATEGGAAASPGDGSQASRGAAAILGGGSAASRGAAAILGGGSAASRGARSTASERQGLLRARTTTDAQGRFAISGLAEGFYELSATATHHAWTHRPGVPTGATDLELVLPAPGTLVLDVADAASGDPVLDPSVALTLPDTHQHLQGGLPERYEIAADPAQPGLVRVRGIGLEGARLTVSAPGYGPYLGDEPGLPPGATVVREVRLHAALRLAGSVVDERDEPLAGVRITLASTADRRGHRTESDAEGRFALDDLSAGEYEIDARAPGLLESLREPLELLASRDDFRVRLFREAQVGGLVRDRDGVPAPGTMVVALPLWSVPAFVDLLPEPGIDLASHVWSRLPHAAADDDGRYLLTRMLPGEYALFATRDASLPDDLKRRRWNAQPTPAPEHALRRELPGGLASAQDLALPVLTGVVGTLLADGRPAAGATVTLYAPVDGSASWRQAGETHSGDDGRYELLDQAPGTVAVIVQADATSLPVCRRLELLPGVETRHDVAIGGGLVRGTVVDAQTQQPVPGVTVYARPDISPDSTWLLATGFDQEELRLMNARPGPDSVATTSDAQGRFTLRHLPPGPVAVMTQGGGTLPAWAPWATLDDREPLEVTLEVTRGATIELTIARRDGSPIDANDDGVILQLRDALEDRVLDHGYPEAGAARFEGLAGGRYELRALDRNTDAVLLRETVQVTLGATAHVDLALDD